MQRTLHCQLLKDLLLMRKWCDIKEVGRIVLVTVATGFL